MVMKPKNMKNIEPKNILMIRSGAIGDVLMTTPLVEAVRAAWPKARINYLVGKWSSSVLKNNPCVDGVIEFDDNIIVKRNIIKALALAKKIGKMNFDTCLVLDKSWLWSLFAKIAKIPLRVGFRRKGLINTMLNTNNVSIPFFASKYELEYYLDIARKLDLDIKTNRMRLYPSKDDEFVANSIIETNKAVLNNKKITGIAPGGAENPGQSLVAKRWPLENYKALVKQLVERKDTAVLLFGGSSDKEICDELEGIDTKKIISVAGKITIQQSYLLMKKCSYFVTHDSGAMHIVSAAGLGKKLIAIFGPTSPKRFAPKDATVLKPKKLPFGYNPEQDVYKSIPQSKIEYASVGDVMRVIE